MEMSRRISSKCSGLKLGENMKSNLLSTEFTSAKMSHKRRERVLSPKQKQYADLLRFVEDESKYNV